ncbi:hypothetical protein ACHAWT_003105 [Skeletonema menzelii]|mmetsp:Transcript_9770/g.16156  ORF Transcript_9770/g.16156 Transcript_9770/m.16156 type:complete len:259 (-) Transcript_9770:43-819(-)
MLCHNTDVLTMMVQFERRNTAAELVGDPLAEMPTQAGGLTSSALSGLEASLYSDTDLQKRLNDALDENKKNEAIIMRLREQILRHQEQERSMETKIIELSMDLAMAKAEVDRQQLKSSQLEQQPQECTLHRAEHASKEANQFVPTDFSSRKNRTRTRSHVRSQSLTDFNEETASKNTGSSDNNLFQSMGRRITNLDSSFRSLRQSVLMHGQELTSSMKSESSLEKRKSLSGSMNISSNFIQTDVFDCDNNSSIDWADS